MATLAASKPPKHKVSYGASGVHEWIMDVFVAFDADSTFAADESIAVGEDCPVCGCRIVRHDAPSGAALQHAWIGVAWYEHGWGQPDGRPSAPP